MSDDLERLESWAGALLAKLSPAARRQLTRTVALELRSSQQSRVKRQQNPDGTQFEPRKRASSKAPARPVRFLYKKPGGQQRLVDLRSWNYQGRLIVGFDREVNDNRSFSLDHVVRFLPPGKGAGGASLRSKRGRIKRAAMFRKLTAPSQLRAIGSADQALVSFAPRVTRIARVHQFGLKDRPAPGARPVDYPQRQLLGFSDADIELVRDLLLEHLAG